MLPVDRVRKVASFRPERSGAEKSISSLNFNNLKGIIPKDCRSWRSELCRNETLK